MKTIKRTAAVACIFLFMLLCLCMGLTAVPHVYAEEVAFSEAVGISFSLEHKAGETWRPTVTVKITDTGNEKNVWTTVPTTGCALWSPESGRATWWGMKFPSNDYSFKGEVFVPLTYSATTGGYCTSTANESWNTLFYPTAANTDPVWPTSATVTVESNAGAQNATIGDIKLLSQAEANAFKGRTSFDPSLFGGAEDNTFKTIADDINAMGLDTLDYFKAPTKKGTNVAFWGLSESVVLNTYGIALRVVNRASSAVGLAADLYIDDKNMITTWATDNARCGDVYATYVGKDGTVSKLTASTWQLNIPASANGTVFLPWTLFMQKSSSQSAAPTSAFLGFVSYFKHIRWYFTSTTDSACDLAIGDINLIKPNGSSAVSYTSTTVKNAASYEKIPSYTLNYTVNETNDTSEVALMIDGEEIAAGTDRTVYWGQKITYNIKSEKDFFNVSSSTLGGVETVLNGYVLGDESSAELSVNLTAGVSKPNGLEVELSDKDISLSGNSALAVYVNNTTENDLPLSVSVIDAENSAYWHTGNDWTLILSSEEKTLFTSPVIPTGYRGYAIVMLTDGKDSVRFTYRNGVFQSQGEDAFPESVKKDFYIRLGELEPDSVAALVEREKCMITEGGNAFIEAACETAENMLRAEELSSQVSELLAQDSSEMNVLRFSGPSNPLGYISIDLTKSDAASAEPVALVVRAKVLSAYFDIDPHFTDISNKEYCTTGGSVGMFMLNTDGTVTDLTTAPNSVYYRLSGDGLLVIPVACSSYFPWASGTSSGRWGTLKTITSWLRNSTDENARTMIALGSFSYLNADGTLTSVFDFGSDEDEVTKNIELKNNLYKSRLTQTSVSVKVNESLTDTTAFVSGLTDGKASLGDKLSLYAADGYRITYVAIYYSETKYTFLEPTDGGNYEYIMLDDDEHIEIRIETEKLTEEKPPQSGGGNSCGGCRSAASVYTALISALGLIGFGFVFLKR